MKFRVHRTYLFLTIILFLIEILIAIKGRNFFFLRAYIGDVLVVILLYCFLLSFVEIRNKVGLLIGIFVFSVIVEISQYFKLAEILGFEEGSVGAIVMGNYFSWGDIICYATGCVLVFILDKIIIKFK